MNAPTRMTAAREAWWKRENLLPGVVLLALTVAAWAYTIDQARAMRNLAMGWARRGSSPCFSSAGQQ